MAAKNVRIKILLHQSKFITILKKFNIVLRRNSSFDQLDIVSMLAEAYESVQHAIEAHDPVTTIK